MRRNDLAILATMCVTLAATASANAEWTESRVLAWPELMKGHPSPLPVIDDDGSAYVKIEHAESQRVTIHVATIDDVSPTAQGFAIEGRIRYTNVEGDAYLEMWTVTPDGQRFFTRTLNDSGPMGKITGSSDWREFFLPFRFTKTPPKHVTLEINAVLPGRGHIDIGPIRIVNLSPDLFLQQGGWWPARAAGWIGGVAGGTFGILFGVIGVLEGRRKCPRLVMAVLTICMVVGTISLLAGGVAAILHQPFFVWYPLVLLGGILLPIAIVSRVRIQRQRRQIELRQMQAMDIA